MRGGMLLMPRPSRSRLLRDNAFSEVKRYDRAIDAIREEHGEEAARKVMAARALDLARKRGARIPRPGKFVRGARVRTP